MRCKRVNTDRLLKRQMSEFQFQTTEKLECMMHEDKYSKRSQSFLIGSNSYTKRTLKYRYGEVTSFNMDSQESKTQDDPFNPSELCALELTVKL